MNPWRSPLALLILTKAPVAPVEKGGTGFKVPLFKGDLGGSLTLNHSLKTCVYTVAFQGGRRLLKSPFLRGIEGDLPGKTEYGWKFLLTLL